MKKFLVPLDFSDASINAAEYAVALTSQIPEAEIILYHVYNRISLPTLTSKDEGSRQHVSENELNEVKAKISQGKDNISTVVEEGSFVETLCEYALGNAIDMVIMGITGSSRIKQVFMGTNTLNVIRQIDCPVMIIPAEAKFSGLKKVVFTSDFTDVARTTPFVSLRKILDTFKPSLDILNVNSEHFVELTPEFKIEREAMEDKLGTYNPEFSFLRSYDFVEGISSYVETREMDAIITVPRKHSFLSQLFKTSHTKKLAYHSRVPIIAVPA
jgi:nucleotide-binding universal stress UspA family protein